MDFDYYQDAASGTDQFAGQKGSKDDGLMIPLLGIAGETGTLLAEFKKKIRDKDSYEGFQEKAEEELGDVLWYLSNIATRLGPVVVRDRFKELAENKREVAGYWGPRGQSAGHQAGRRRVELPYGLVSPSRSQKPAP